jgi:hypothetical protein
LLLLSLTVLPGQHALGQNGPSPKFTRVNKPGFGDKHNNYAWSMQWFKGKLFVGTNRDFHLVELATLNFYYPYLHVYPPPPDSCTVAPPSPYDLDLRAEIWCYTPSTGVWERVFQSPSDLPNPLAPGKTVARDIGFRDMTVVQEPDGTQALYVGGVSAREYIPGLPWPRLLRSTDGVNFTPVNLTIPDVPSTFMGFRTLIPYNGKLYVTATTELVGDGVVIESSDPASGVFRVVTSPDLLAYEMAVFNGFLYIGAGDKTTGYSVWKTDASGEPPYKLTPVVKNGAGRGPAMVSVVSMHTFQNRLYVGSSGFFSLLPPCELIRIKPDDSWEVVVGNARFDFSTFRTKFPISGLPDGFGNAFNAHIWRMEGNGGFLWAGTNDISWGYRSLASLFPWITQEFGFDLYATSDGAHWFRVTRNGFGSPTSFGLRTFASTPSGLFLGSANQCIGTEVWLGGTPDNTAAARGMVVHTAAPESLEIEAQGGAALLSWDPLQGAVKFYVYRSDQERMPIPLQPGTDKPSNELWVPGPFRKIGTSTGPAFRDVTAGGGTRSVYYVQAVDRRGNVSGESNVTALSPSTPPGTTFGAAASALQDLAGKGKSRAARAARLRKLLDQAQTAAAKGDLSGTRRSLETLQNQVAEDAGGALSQVEVDDLKSLFAKLLRRVRLAQAGILPARALRAPRDSVREPRPVPP